MEGQENTTQNQNPAPAQKEEKSFETKWSWGGLMMEQVLIIASKRYKFLLLYLLMLIPILNIFAIAGIKLYFAIRGREFVKAGSGFSNDDEYRGFIKGVDHAGKVLFFIGVAILAVVLIASLVFGLQISQEFKDGNFDFVDQESADELEEALESLEGEFEGIENINVDIDVN